MKAEGRTVLLTTHYMEEAERLADRVAIIDYGRIVALDTPAALVRLLDTGGKVECTLSAPLPKERLRECPEIADLHAENGRLSFRTKNTKQAVVELLSASDACGITVEDLRISRPNLEDVFLHLTGHRLRE